MKCRTYPMASRVFLGVFLAVLWAGAVRAETYLMVISGLPGEDGYQQLFTEWTEQLIDSASQSGIAEQRIVHLSPEPPAEAAAQTDVLAGVSVGVSDAAGIAQAIATMGEQLQVGDQLWIVLLGHGSAQGKQTYFNIPGPDISSEQFAQHLASLQVERLVVVATMASSGGFLQDLAGPQRVIISATRSGAERYFAHFGGFWIQALEPSRGGDLDKDGKISLLEAFDYARSEVEQLYRSDRRLVTEHALLDDNGDGQGSAEPKAIGTEDGALAARTFLLDQSDLAAADPEHAALLDQQQALEQRLQAWIVRKAELAMTTYYDGLETLLVDLTQVDRALRAKAQQQQSQL